MILKSHFWRVRSYLKTGQPCVPCAPLVHLPAFGAFFEQVWRPDQTQLEYENCHEELGRFHHSPSSSDLKAIEASGRITKDWCWAIASHRLHSFGPNALFILGSPFTYIFLFAWSGYQTKTTSKLNISTRPGQEFWLSRCPSAQWPHPRKMRIPNHRGSWRRHIMGMDAIPYHGYGMVWYHIMGMDATQPVTRARKMPQSGGNTVTCHLFPPSWSWSSRSVHFSSPSVRIPIARLYISELLKPHISWCKTSANLVSCLWQRALELGGIIFLRRFTHQPLKGSAS